jgi:hypothetical protein
MRSGEVVASTRKSLRGRGAQGPRAAADAAFVDAGALDDPRVGGVKGLGELVVGDDPIGHGNAPTLESNTHYSPFANLSG